jgi:hypothetical protein
MEIENLALVGGSLPPRALSLVREWAARHRASLLRNWDAAREGLPLERIPGLE